MNTVRVALANLCYPAHPADAVERVQGAIVRAGEAHASVICFPECYVPGYRGLGHLPPAPDADFLERAWNAIAEAAARARLVVLLGTERLTDEGLLASVLVIDRDGTRLGFQDKVQIAPGEEGTYLSAKSGRRVFEAAGFKFGIAICHEGVRYPETVRWAARRGAQVVFHPHLEERELGSYQPRTFCDPANSFHEKAMLCRAAENGCYFVSANYASQGSPTTSAVVRPDGSVLAWQPYGEEGLLVADLELDAATLLLASRCREP